MQNRINVKLPAVLVSLGVAATFISLGIFLDGRVLPEQPQMGAVFETPETEESAPNLPAEPHEASVDHAATAHLKQAIESTNRHEAEASSVLAQRLDRAKAMMSESQQIFAQKGLIRSGQADTKRTQAFNSQLESLKAQLAGME